MARKIKEDLTGKVFGRLQVIVWDKEKRLWQCKCQCNNIKYLRSGHLTSGGVVSCGCKRSEYEDLTGQKFHKLCVIKHSCKKKNQHYWHCVCDCGNNTEVSGISLKSNNTKSCGCLLGEINAKRNFIHGLAIGKKAGVYNPEYEKYLRRKPEYRIRKNISTMIWSSLKKNNSSKNNKSVWNYLPYSLEELKNHLEKQFVDWMTWENYGEWHIDHIVPKSSFSYSKMTEQAFLDCWALSNLRPLSKNENLKKGKKIS